MCVHVGLLAWSAVRHSPTFNEPAHLAAGISHWQLGRFGLYRVNPPLVRLVAALPVLAVGANTDWTAYAEGPSSRAAPAVGAAFVVANGERSLWLFTLARWACIPFSLVGAAFCFLWAREICRSDWAGVLALVLWCFDPNILAHGALITCDCAAASFGVGAAYSYWRWFKRPTWTRAVSAGALLGLAELCKTTWVILFGLWPVLWVLRITCEKVVLERTPLRWLRELAQLTIILVVAVYLVNLVYGFEGTFTRLGDFEFVSQTLCDKDTAEGSGNRFRTSCVSPMPVPLPANYVRGIDIQKRDFEHFGWRSYLGGEWKDEGWWYYYCYGLMVKMPHGSQALVILAMLSVVVTRWKRSCQKVRLAFRNRGMYKIKIPLCVSSLSRSHDKEGDCREVAGERNSVRGPKMGCPSLMDLTILFTPPAVLFTLVSSQREFNHHVRYVLPALGFCIVLVGGTIPRLPKGRIVAYSLAVWAVTSSIWQFPHSLAYFNELAGGCRNGYKHLLHSNLDWGQDLLFLRDWAQQHGEVDNLRVAYYGSIGPQDIGLSFRPPAYGPHDGDYQQVETLLDRGWYAISVNYLCGDLFQLTNRKGYGAFRDLPEYDVVGATFHIYYLSGRPQILDGGRASRGGEPDYKGTVGPSAGVDGIDSHGSSKGVRPL